MLNNRGQTMREKLRDNWEQSLLGKNTMFKYAKEVLLDCKLRWWNNLDGKRKKITLQEIIGHPMPETFKMIW